ncbi:MAG: hypothetical protein DCC68_09775 [Planctomycetota bacterium]|nr:MAG: hypothetical protein DCC68_09775 [Planctomycetota bacterium]
MNDTDSTPEYRPVSRLAVTGLALGVASLIVFVAPPVAVAIPAVAVAVCAAAMLRIRRDPSLAGFALARAGLLFALFSLAAGPSYALARYWQLRRTAERFAASFVERLLSGDIRAAHQMTLPPNQRFAPDRPLADGYRDDATARDRLAEFARDPVVERLRALHGTEVARVHVAWHEALRDLDGFAVHVYVGGDTRESARAVVRVLVERSAAKPHDWIVSERLLEGNRDSSPK